MFNLENRFQSFLKLFQKLLIAHWQTLLLLFVGVGLPLLVFEQLAIIVWQKGGFAWDRSILLSIHQTAQPGLDAFAKTITPLGVKKGVVPATIAIAVMMVYQKRWRSLTYLLVAVGGTGLINLSAKAFFHRVRPALWEAAPHSGFSFPSGHAMSSMSFVAALVILTWGTRWCWLIGTLGGGFVVAIGWTRLYLGVHFPSDILAGWMVSLAWVIGVSLIIRPHLKPENLEPPLEETSLMPEELQT
jgi:membrane-associated phospholipid phosphatase